MKKIHLEFPKEDGILLTKKGLMRVNYYKELVVVKPLTKSPTNLALLRNYLREKLMRELRSDHHSRHQPTTSTSPSEGDSSSKPEEDPASSDQSSSDPSPTLPTSSEWTLPPLLTKWTDIVLETMTKDPEVVGRKMGKVDLDMKPAIFLGNHPTIHRMVLYRMVRFMREAYKDHKSEDILVIHREQRPVPQSKGDNKRHVLSVNDVLLLLPTTLSQSAAHLRFELGTHFCRKCRITMAVSPGEEVTCTCGASLEELRCMGTIHSHGSMAAFSSGTDNKHEIPHIGFHMTVGNLDKVQESLVLSFCDGAVRIPLNTSDLFAVEKEDVVFDGQINNWILFRRETKKKQEEERKRTAGNVVGRTRIRNIKIDAPSSSTGAAIEESESSHLTHGSLFEGGAVDPVLEEEGWGEDEAGEWEDDNLAMTRVENEEGNRDAAMSLRFEKCGNPQGVEAILEMLGEAFSAKMRWTEVMTVIRRCSWSMTQNEVERVTRRVAFILESMTASDQDYPKVSILLDHLVFVANTDKRREASRT